MKDKKKIIICCALTIVIIVVGVTVGVFVGKNKTKTPDVTTTTTVPSTESDKPAIGQNVDVDEKISDTVVEGGVANGICTYKGIDYVALGDGFYTVNTQGKNRYLRRKSVVLFQ